MNADMCEVERASVLYVLFPILEAGEQPTNIFHTYHHTNMYLTVAILFFIRVGYYRYCSAIICLSGGG